MSIRNRQASPKMLLGVETILLKHARPLEINTTLVKQACLLVSKNKLNKQSQTNSNSQYFI